MAEIAARRWLFLFLVALSTAGAVFKLYQVLRIGGIDTIEALFLVLFAILFGWISISFWMTVFGAFARLTGARLLPLPETASVSNSRTAILMPIFNEDVPKVFSGVQAVFESLAAEGDFDFFVLSDSTDPANWVAEEVAWADLRLRLEPDARLYYRHRHHNAGRKSGNIHDFCENWGSSYDYMVILDADSLMSGQTLRSLVRLMDTNPKVALIQAPATLVGRRTLFARIQQFASSAYGPTYNAGLSWLQGGDGNYWGHNAIIRVKAFQSSCGLPRLPGRAPFGGEIMSHDFVEAALLLRAGWQVWMAPDLSGSYEEPPPTIADHLKRDRRWAQGNLQHARIVLAQGLKLPSRLHMAMGIMSYVSSPLWLLLLIVSGLEMFFPQGLASLAAGSRHPEFALPISEAAPLFQLTIATLVLLYAPKLLALTVLLSDPKAVKTHGGIFGAVRSVILESIFATLFAPVMMLVHSWFLLSIATGRATGWGTQARSDRGLSLWFVLRRYWLFSALGLAGATLFTRHAPEGLIWVSPLLAGLILAVPLVWLSSSLNLGEATARWRTFLVPSETTTIPVLERARQLEKARERADADYRHLLLDDPSVMALHLGLLKETPRQPMAPHDRLEALAEAASRRDTGGFSRQDWMALLSDARSLQTVRSWQERLSGASGLPGPIAETLRR